MEDWEELSEEELLAAAEQAAQAAEEETDDEQICFYLKQAAGQYAAAGEKHWRKQLLYLRKLAVQYEKQEAYEQALDARTQTVELLRSLTSPTKTELGLLAEMLTYRGLTHYNMEHFDRERTDYDEAIALRKTIGNFENNYCALSIVYCNYADTLLKEENFQGALEQYSASEKIAKKYIREYPWRPASAGTSPGYDNKAGLICLARAQLERAEHFKGRPDWRSMVIKAYSDAIHTYRKLLRRNTLTKEERAEAMEYLAIAYNGRGVCYYAEKKYSGEISDCAHALSLRGAMEQTPDNHLQSIVVLRNQCDCYEIMEQHEKAVECCAKALKLADRVEEAAPGRYRRSERIDLLLSCAGNLDGAGKFEQAKERYTQALELLAQEKADGTPNEEYTALCYFRRALDVSRCKQRLYGDGLVDYGHALDALDAMESTPRTEEFRMRILRSRGDLAFAMGFFEIGEADFAKAAEIERSLPQPEEAASA